MPSAIDFKLREEEIMPYFDYPFFPPSKPLAAQGGIKAQSRRGSFGESWWARRWIEVLEGFDIASRLQRGRTYARSGQVLSIDIAPGVVKSKVQGSSPSPYRVKITLATLAVGDEEKLAAVLASDLAIAARLLAGEMPPEIEIAFEAAGLSLFPKPNSDLETSCSCPDWSNPCKHVAATYYLLAEEFNRDPFLLLKLRGIDRKRLMTLLGQSLPILKMLSSLPEPVSVESEGARQANDASTPRTVTASQGKPKIETDDLNAFWQGGEVGTEIIAVPSGSQEGMMAVARLGAFPFWSGEKPLAEILNPYYKAVSEKGLKLCGGESIPSAKR